MESSLKDTSPLTVPGIARDIQAIGEALAAGGLEADRNSSDPGENLSLLTAVKSQAVNIPEEFGGIWSGAGFHSWSSYVRLQTLIASFDGATGQNWGTGGMVCRELLGAETPLPGSTKAEIASRVLEDGLRLCASNSETGSPTPVVARKVPGGLRLNGVKTFNTNSGGQGMASVGCRVDGEEGRHHVLVDLSGPGVRLHHDWDVIGQRGTYSQTITYDDVFVPEGWYYAAPRPHPAQGSSVMMVHAALMLGIGQGAFRETVRYLRKTQRVMLPGYPSSAEDPVLVAKLGGISIELAAAEALLNEVARRIDTFGQDSDPETLAVSGYRAKVACVEAALRASAEVIEFTGARGASSKYALDRFWRNARIFASHDPTEAKKAYVGSFELTGRLPERAEFLRI